MHARTHARTFELSAVDAVQDLQERRGEVPRRRLRRGQRRRGSERVLRATRRCAAAAAGAGTERVAGGDVRRRHRRLDEGLAVRGAPAQRAHVGAHGDGAALFVHGHPVVACGVDNKRRDGGVRRPPVGVLDSERQHRRAGHALLHPAVLRQRLQDGVALDAHRVRHALVGHAVDDARAQLERRVQEGLGDEQGHPRVGEQERDGPRQAPRDSQLRGLAQRPLKVHRRQEQLLQPRLHGLAQRPVAVGHQLAEPLDELLLAAGTRGGGGGQR